MKNRGFTFIELIVTVAIVAILASVAMPMLQMTVQRSKENELRTNLRMIRNAIDAYKKAADEGRIETTIDQSGYPPNLAVLVEGVPDIKDVKKRKIRFLRRIPIDPVNTKNINTDQPWGLRSYASEASDPAEGDDVYDIYSLSPQTGTNGRPYAQW